MCRYLLPINYIWQDLNAVDISDNFSDIFQRSDLSIEVTKVKKISKPIPTHIVKLFPANISNLNIRFY